MVIGLRGVKSKRRIIQPHLTNKTHIHQYYYIYVQCSTQPFTNSVSLYIASPKITANKVAILNVFIVFVFKGCVVIFYTTVTGFPLDNTKSPMSEAAILLPLNRKKSIFQSLYFTCIYVWDYIKLILWSLTNPL